MIKEDLLKKYVSVFKNLDLKISNYNKKDSKNNKGYIINLEDYEKLKKKINFDKNKSKGSERSYDIKFEDRLMIIPELEFKTNQYLINMLLNGNKYKIVDSTFWKIICDKAKDNSPLTDFEIANNTLNLIINFNGQTALKFDNKKKDNIIEESSLKSKSGNNFDEIKKIYQNIKHFYDFQNLVENSLKSIKESKVNIKGFLVEKDLIDQWKQKIEYETLKKDFFTPQKSEKIIRDKIIYIFAKKQLKFFDLTDIKFNEYNTKEKVELFLKTKSLVLVNKEFLSFFKRCNTLKEIDFNLYEETIEINFDTTNTLLFKTNNNYILSEKDNKGASNTIGNNDDNSLDNIFAKDILTILLYINLDEREFLEKVEKSKNNINASISGYSLINSNFLDELKKFFSCEEEIVKLVADYKIKSISEINFQLIDNIEKQNKMLLDKLYSQKQSFLNKFTSNKAYTINSKKLINNQFSITYTYPIDFLIVQQRLITKLNNIIGNSDNNSEEISLGFNLGNVIFRPTKGKFVDEKKNFAYIFSLIMDNKRFIKFNPEVLISFDTKESMHNHFQKLIGDEALIDSSINEITHINATYRCKSMLINKTNTKLNTQTGSVQNNNVQINSDNNNLNHENINKYLTYSLKLYKEYSSLKKQIGEKNNQKENECYLINKNFIEEVHKILCFNDINDEFDKNAELIKDFKGEKEKIEKIKNGIKLGILKQLNELDENKIKENLKLKGNITFDLSKSSIGEKSENIFYYNNCRIINKNIWTILKEIAKNEVDIIQSVKCIFDNGNIIILIKDGTDKVINIGNLDNDKDDLIIKFVIKEEAFLDIFADFKKDGFDHIGSVSPDKILFTKNEYKTNFSTKSNNTNSTNNNSNIKKNTTIKNNTNNSAKNSNNNTTKNTRETNVGNKTAKDKAKKSISTSQIYSKPKNEEKIKEIKRGSIKSSSINLTNEPKITNIEKKNETPTNTPIVKEVKIDEKLKSLILLSINQQKNYATTQNGNNKGYKVYLINTIFEKYKLNEINNLIKENASKINTKINEINQSELPTISSKISLIIPKLNQDKLKQLNEEINKIQEATSSKFEPKSETINLLNSKNIKIYTDFLISPENTYNQLKKSFAISQDIKPVYYIHNTSGDIIYFDKILLYGKIDKNKNKYEIKYIFEFDTESDLIKEITEIKNGVEAYIHLKSVFIDSNKKDIHSPIFSYNKTIGNVYKYNPNTDYSKCIDYTKYIKNDKLSKFIALYKFYTETKKNLNKFSNQTEKYYLLKEETIYEIQKSCNYNEFKQIFEENNINLDIDSNNKDDKKILKIIKNIPKDILDKKFIYNSSFIKIKKNDIEPDIITVVNPNNPNEYAMAYDNFGIIDKKIAELFIEGIASTTMSYSPYSSNDKNFFDCTLNEGKILIDYQQKVGNENYVSIIGSVDPINFFIINEYALIYKDFSGCSSHNKSIKNKLNNYIQGLRFYNRVQPITQDIYKEIGNIIEIEQTTDKKNKIITKSIITPNPPYDQTPIPPKPPISNPPYNSNDEEYNLNPKIQNIFSIRQYFTVPPLIGLENIGATCYMNATLQCFCNVEKFVDYFKYNKHLIDTVKNDINKRKLCSSFKLLVEKLWPDDYTTKIKTYYAPHEYKNKISSMDSLFQGVQANDSKDLVNFIIMTLHSELNKAKNFNITSPNPSFNEQRNQQIMLNNFIQSFQATNQSLISDLFYAVNCNIIQCLGCNAQTFNYQTYFFIVFPLEEVRKYKFQNINQFNSFNNMFNNNNQVNIYECFEYEKKITYMSGQNAMHCNYCQRTCNSSMCTVLTTGPEVLIIILNRGKGIEFNVKIIFDERLNLANYIQFGNTGVNYELIGVITHLGDNSMSGHFIAYCKSPISKTWYQYNDAMVNPVNNFRTEVIDFAMPYLLFYQKMH